MATPQWEALRGFIDAMTPVQRSVAADTLKCEASVNGLRRAAYAYSRDNYKFSENAKGYEAVHAMLALAVGAPAPSNANGATVPDASLESFKPETPAERERKAPKPLSPTWEEGVEAIAAKVSAPGLTEADVRRIVKSEVKALIDDVRVAKIILTCDGHTQELEGLHHKDFAKLLKVCSARQGDGYRPNIWLAGPPGSGKTHSARAIAKAFDAAFEYNGALSMPHEVLGFIDAAGKYHETAFYRGFTSKAVYLFDECDGSENAPLLALNAALANGHASFPNGSRERHKDNIIIAGANTLGLGATADFAGRTRIDAAFLDRFPVKLFWDYDAKLEAALSGNEQWARTVQDARSKARAAGLKVMITPRATIAGAALIAAGFTAREAKELTYLASLTEEQKRMVE